VWTFFLTQSMTNRLFKTQGKLRPVSYLFVSRTNGFCNVVSC
jgi:hypothetical protein